MMRQLRRMTQIIETHRYERSDADARAGKSITNYEI